MGAKRICICCGEKFEYCPSCGNVNQPSWKRIYDCEDCMEIAHILQASKGKFGISKDEAKRQMKKYPDALEKIFDYDSLTANAIKELFDIKDDDRKDKVVITYVPSEESGKIEKIETSEEVHEETLDSEEIKIVDMTEEVDNNNPVVEAEIAEEVFDGDKNNKSEYKNSGNKRKRYYTNKK